MIEVLESKEYSILQSEVAKAGITVKSKTDKLVELAFADFPFLMESHADEVAVEVKALRKKIRTLEARLAKMESQFSPNSKSTEASEVGLKEKLLEAIGMAEEKEKDDLKQIKGIGPKMEEMLNSIGVFTFQQMSKMTETQYDLVDKMLSAFQGRAQRDEWADQAKELVD